MPSSSSVRPPLPPVQTRGSSQLESERRFGEPVSRMKGEACLEAALLSLSDRHGCSDDGRGNVGDHGLHGIPIMQLEQLSSLILRKHELFNLFVRLSALISPLPSRPSHPTHIRHLPTIRHPLDRS
jgi:hypothetical protein